MDPIVWTKTPATSLSNLGKTEKGFCSDGSTILTPDKGVHDNGMRVMHEDVEWYLEGQNDVAGIPGMKVPSTMRIYKKTYCDARDHDDKRNTAEKLILNDIACQANVEPPEEVK